MSFMVIAVAMLAAFCLQFLFQMVQMKSFNKFYTKLRKKGRVAIGKAKGGFHAGAISEMTTLDPAFKNPCATAFPIPDAPPVTMTVFPSRFNQDSLIIILL